jgi:hypothetical protein
MKRLILPCRSAGVKRANWLERLMSAVAFGLLVASASCTKPVEHPPQVPPADPPKPPPAAVLRVRLHYAGGRTMTGGVAFIVSTGIGKAVAVTSWHLAPRNSKGARLARFEVLDPLRAEAVAAGTGLVGRSGATFKTFDFSRDLALVALDRVPETAHLEIAPPPRTGQRILLLTLGPSDKSEQLAVTGRVVEADPQRTTVELDTAVDARGISGSPIVDATTGKLVAITQVRVDRAATPILFATPAPALAEALAEEKTARLAEWK